MRASRLPTAALVAAALAMSVSACGDADASRRADDRGDESPTASLDAAAAPGDACGWIPLDEVARVLGPVAQPPTAVESLDELAPARPGEACVYRLARQPDSVVLAVRLSGVADDGHAMGMLARRFARELGEDEPADGAPTPPPATRAEWDADGTVLLSSYAEAFGGRQGHIGIVAASRTGTVPIETLAALAAVVRDRIPDRPFAVPVDPILAELDLPEEAPMAAPSGPEPCSLLTREEAEAVLGELISAPYRSSGNTPLGAPRGDSCSYLTAGHHALVIRPEWTQGRTVFEMARGVTGMVERVIGEDGSAATDTLDGPWDDVSRSVTGSLFFLKGDRMLEITWGTSSTDLAGALRLARAAVARL